MYRGRLQRDLRHWAEAGLIPQATADALLQEYDSRPHSFTVGRVLMMLAAVLVSAALLVFIAAQWEEMSRPLRSGLLISGIWLFYGLAAFTSIRRNTYLPGVFLVLGTTAFGASIALVGQMYHLSGDATSSAMLWFVMCVASALLFRSAALTYYAGLLGWFFLAMLATESWSGQEGWWLFAPPLMALVVVGLAYYTGAMRARHLSYLLLLGWLSWLYIDRHAMVSAGAYALAGIILFLLAAVPVSPLHKAARQAGAAPAFYSFVLGLMGLVLYQVDNGLFFGNGADAVATAAPAVAAAAFAVFGLALEGRDNGAVRYLGYVVFAGEILYLSMQLAGTMLGTSGLFLSSGAILAFVAWLVLRLEKRFGTAGAASKGA